MSMFPEFEIVRRLRKSMRQAISDARRRQAKKLKPAPVDVTVDEMMSILARQQYKCALTGLPFWGCGVQFGPSIPSIDRIRARDGYTADNVRVVLLGVNGLRGAGTDEDLYRIARALIAYRPRAAAFKAAAARRKVTA